MSSKNRPSEPTADMVAVREAELRMQPQYYDDLTITWLYRPHNITLMILIGCFVLWKAFFRIDTSTEENIRDGVLWCFFLFLPLSIIAFPNGPFCRPHPAFWRAITGIQVAYFFFLVLLLFQNRDDARQMFRYVDPKLGVELVPKDYGAEGACTLTKENIMDVVDDVFFGAHLIGWAVKAMLLRSYAFCWTVSILWELAELSLIPWLPNFKECWWDSWIIDVLLCNGIGIFIGMQICKFLEYKDYKWQGFMRIESSTKKLQRAVMQFTPFSWTKVRWEFTTSAKNFLALVLLGFFLVMSEINGFFLKDILWIPSVHILTLGRLALWTFFGAPAMREYYLYCTDPTCKRLGLNCWLAALLIVVELAICVKFGRGLFPQRIHPMVPLAWIIGLVLFISIMLEWIVWNNYRESKLSQKKQE